MPNDFQNLVQEAISSPAVTDGKPYFLGDHALVKFSSGLDSAGPEVHWLADRKNRTLRPFESETALRNAFGEGYDAAIRHCVNVAHPQIMENGDIASGVLKGFSILDPEYAIREDGSAKELDFSNHHLRSRYGKPVNPQAEEKAARTLEHVLGVMKSRDAKDISPAEIEKLRRDERRVAFYLNALAYGSYTGKDVRDDIIARSKK